MKTFKRIFSAVLAAAMIFAFAACSAAPAVTATPTAAPSAAGTPTATPTPEPTPVPDDTAIRVAALKGPTAIGMIQLIDEAPANLEFTLASSPDEITGTIVTGGFDVACVPTNLAANLYKKTGGEWQLAALNTMGVLYVVETGDTIHSVADLEGKTIWSSGKGSTPEYALNYILEKNGVTADVQYASEHAEIATMLAGGSATVAVLPQPFVASVLMQNSSARVALDLTDEWAAVSDNEGGLTMGCVIVRKAFADEHPQAVADFFKKYAASVEFVNDPANIDSAAEMVVNAGIIAKAEIAKQAIPECNIVFVTGDEMRAQAGGFFEVLYAANPQSVGGEIPDDGIYFDVAQ